jgi:sn-glycerol 3-phosphate transport system substrate-binding protein
MRRTTRPVAALTVAAALALGALSAGEAAASTASTRSAVKLPPCPLGALARAKKPVQITLWHGLTAANERALQQLTSQFNAAHPDIHVTLVNNITYEEDLHKFVAGLSTGDLPDLVQIEDTGLQQMIDTRAVLPAASCVKADNYSGQLSDFVDRVVRYWSVKGVIYPMPFNVSNPVFLYNKKAFVKAGLDPNSPPQTLEQVTADAQKLKASGAVARAGYGLKTDPWFLEQWMAKAGEPFVNNSNGRQARATKAVFKNAAGQQVFSWMAQMVRSGNALANIDQGPSAFDNLFGIGAGNMAMTVDTSATLGTVTQVLGSGQFPNVELGVAPLPGPVGKGGVLVGGAALFLSAKSAPEKQAAAWQYLKFLDTPENQASFAAASGYVPVRKSAVNLPAIQQLWARIPGYKVAYDQLLTGVNNVATAGAVIGDYLGVRNAVRNAEEAMFSSGAKASAALAQAQQNASAAIQAYNARVGAG